MTKKDVTRVEIILAGVGGKGVHIAADSLIKGGMREYRYALWNPVPATGVRAAPIHGVIILSDSEIHSPTLSQFDILGLMEPFLLTAYRNRVKPGGTAIIEEGSADLERDDVTALYIPSTRIATELGDSRCANILFLGAIIGTTGIVSPELIEEEIKKRFGEKEEILSINLAAFHKGLEIGVKGRSS